MITDLLMRRKSFLFILVFVCVLSVTIPPVMVVVSVLVGLASALSLLERAPWKRVTGRDIRVLIVAVVSLAVASMAPDIDSGLSRPPSPPNDSAQSAQPVASTPSVETTAAIPPPPFANRAAQVPGLIVEVDETPEFAALEVGTETSQIFLSGVAFLLATSSFDASLGDKLREAGLRNAAVKSFGMAARVGSLPPSVEALARAEIERVRSLPHLGLWSEDDPHHQFASLAAFLEPDNAAYLREVIAYRNHFGWIEYARNRQLTAPWIRWLALPGAAYERLNEIDSLSDEEHQSWCSRLGLEPQESIDAARGVTIRECGCANGRAATWEADGEHYALSVPGGCIHCENVRVRTGRLIPRVSFEYRGEGYALNGAASGRYPGAAQYKPIEPIWADDPDGVIESQKISIGNMISTGLLLCR